MRIVVDARAAVFSEPTGIGRYTRALLRELPRADPDAEYVAWYVRGRDLLRRPPSFPPGVRGRWMPFPSRLFERLSQRYELPRVEWTLPLDVLFAPNFVPPPTRVRAVVLTVHDLAFRLYPHTAPHGTRRWLDRMDHALSRAARIITPSEWTKRDLCSLYPVEAALVEVVPHGVDHERFRPLPGDAVVATRRRLGINGPYLLFLGGLEPRKNLPMLLEAYARLPPDRPVLVVAGGAVAWNPEGPAALRAALGGLPPDVRRSVVLTGYVDDELVPGLLAGALALVYPSRYEGFGLPVLEAMACGTPVICSNGSALPEVAGGAAVLVDPDDVGALTDAMQWMAADEALRRERSAAGLERASAFRWDRTAARTAQILHAAAPP